MRIESRETNVLSYQRLLIELVWFSRYLTYINVLTLYLSCPAVSLRNRSDERNVKYVGINTV